MSEKDLVNQIKKEEELENSCIGRMFTLLHNAVCYMYEQGLEDEEVANYIGASTPELEAIDDEDLDAFKDIFDDKDAERE